MDRRFPFDQPGGGRPPQMNPAQLRAALGLPPTVEDNFFLQQQAQHPSAQQQHQHDMHLRRLFLQEQQLRSHGELHDYPDIQQRLHRSILINEQLTAQQLGAPSQLQQQQHAAFLREQAKLQLQAEEQLLLLRKQQQQRIGAGFHPDDIALASAAQLDVSQQYHSLRQQPPSPGRLDTQSFDSNHALEAKSAFDAASHVDHQRQQHEQQIQQQREEQVKAFLSSYQGQNNETLINHTLEPLQSNTQPSVDRRNSLSRSSNGSPNPQPTQGQAQLLSPTTTLKKSRAKRKRETSDVQDDDIVSPRSPNATKVKKRRRTKAEMLAAKASEVSSRDSSGTKGSKKLKAPPGSCYARGEPDRNETTDSMLPTLPFLNHQQQSQIVGDDYADLVSNEMDACAQSARFYRSTEGEENRNESDEGLENMATVFEPTEEGLHPKGSVMDLLKVADEFSEVDEAANILISKLGSAADMSESEIDSDDENYVPPRLPHGLPLRRDLKADVPFPLDSPNPTLTFKCRIPQLPEEPVFAHDITDESESVKYHLDRDANSSDQRKQKQRDKSSHGELNASSNHSKSKGKSSSVLEYPYPIDTWWPSVSGMRKERRSVGEASDEDNFEETPSTNSAHKIFRANEPKIRHRLRSSVEPGVLEKLPHCMIHRVRTKRKKNSSAPELVYCWQVTELYPNDIMVNCSKCGTWRHAACGGHCRPFSNLENTHKPFVAICDYCSEEECFLRDYPVGERRLERQRMEQLRRALATSAVMRHASFSKHGGTYKWPLGSVSATHIGGHTRSVHVRHDKAEKQWTDMTSRLGRGNGYRQKERIRSRTKEFERLLISIEDAEGYTDRHNMLLFLQRDTAKDKPAGLENHFGNIFDPADDEFLLPTTQSAIDLDPVQTDSVETDCKEEERDAEVSCRIQRNLVQEDAKQPELETQNGESPDAVPHAHGGTCTRLGCRKRSRFDSQFCSDACGVSALEQELLRTLQDASDVHPSVLRL